MRVVWIGGCSVFVKELQDGYKNVACDACCLDRLMLCFCKRFARWLQKPAHACACCLDRWVLCFCKRVARWLQKHSMCVRVVWIGGCHVFVKSMQDGYKNIACVCVSGSVDAMFL